MVALLAMVVLVGLGEKMAERFLPIYLMALGGGALTIGLLNGMTNFLSRPLFLSRRLFERPSGLQKSAAGF